MTIRDWTKGWLTVVLFGIMAAGLTFGCGGDPPKANLDAATQALQAAEASSNFGEDMSERVRDGLLQGSDIDC